MWRNLKKYLKERGVSVSGYLKTSPVEIASAVERMALAVDANFEKDQTNYAENLIIHDMLIPDPFFEKTANNFNSSPPFGLCDIWKGYYVSNESCWSRDFRSTALSFARKSMHVIRCQWDCRITDSL